MSLGQMKREYCPLACTSEHLEFLLGATEGEPPWSLLRIATPCKVFSAMASRRLREARFAAVCLGSLKENLEQSVDGMRRKELYPVIEYK